MSSNPYRLEVLFKKYLTGACTQQELDEFWSLMAELTDEERLSIGLDEAWRTPQDEVSPNPQQWDQVYARLRRKIQQQKSGVRPFGIKGYMAAAAVITLLFLGYLFYKPTLQPEDNAPSFSTAEPSLPVQTDTRVMTLPDGTEVTLRRNSTLDFDPSTFLNEKTRTVRLTGEAYFDVVHDTERPFIVRFDDYRIKVLGTAFNVNATQQKFEIAVARGKVKVEKSSSHEALGTLTQGDYLAVDKSQPKEIALVAKEVDVDSVRKWTRQDLVFKNENWPTAAKAIYDKYGVDVNMNNARLEHCRFTADISDKSLNDCLDILCAITNAQWRKSGLNVIDISGEGCE